MIINHNIAALNTHRQLSANTANQSKSIEKLSSGLRINRAGDDAAGLAISEKMRGQIRGLDQAARNGQDAISLIQTAEGALNETHSILQRMRELGVQASNDTNTSVDRNEIQKEINQLTSEIDRIADTTQFNTKVLLKGEFGTTATSANGALAIKSASADSIGVGTASITTVAATKTTATGDANISGGVTFTDANNTLILNNVTIKFNNGTYTQQQVIDKINEYKGDTGVEASASTNFLKLDATDFGAKAATYTGNAVASLMGTVTTATTGANASVVGLGSTSVDAKDGRTLTVTDGTFKGMTVQVTATNAVAFGVSTTKSSLNMQIGANENQSMSISIQNMGAKSLGVDAIDVSSAKNAAAAVTTINKAIETVSGERSKLGAYQNRLEHTINNLQTSSENLTAAESRIRDVDMAKGMMEQTKNSILAQAAQAMLAQANQQPQGVLQLLR